MTHKDSGGASWTKKYRLATTSNSKKPATRQCCNNKKIPAEKPVSFLDCEN